MLVLSTAHLKPETAKGWMIGTPDAEPAFIYRKRGYGWFVDVANAEPGEYPLDLAICIAFAKGLGMDWIMFDPDADQLPALPSYEW
jgi:hypothetical protein